MTDRDWDNISYSNMNDAFFDTQAAKISTIPWENNGGGGLYNLDQNGVMLIPILSQTGKSAWPWRLDVWHQGDPSFHQMENMITNRDGVVQKFGESIALLDNEHSFLTQHTSYPTSTGWVGMSNVYLKRLVRSVGRSTSSQAQLIMSIALNDTFTFSGSRDPAIRDLFRNMVASDPAWWRINATSYSAAEGKRFWFVYEDVHNRLVDNDIFPVNWYDKGGYHATTPIDTWMSRWDDMVITSITMTINDQNVFNFEPNVHNYLVYVQEDTTIEHISIQADNTATITAPDSLVDGENIFTVQNHIQRVYTIRVRKNWTFNLDIYKAIFPYTNTNFDINSNQFVNYIQDTQPFQSYTTPTYNLSLEVNCPSEKLVVQWNMIQQPPYITPSSAYQSYSWNSYGIEFHSPHVNCPFYVQITGGEFVDLKNYYVDFNTNCNYNRIAYRHTDVGNSICFMNRIELDTTDLIVFYTPMFNNRFDSTDTTNYSGDNFLHKVEIEFYQENYSLLPKISVIDSLSVSSMINNKVQIINSGGSVQYIEIMTTGKVKKAKVFTRTSKNMDLTEYDCVDVDYTYSNSNYAYNMLNIDNITSYTSAHNQSESEIQQYVHNSINSKRCYVDFQESDSRLDDFCFTWILMLSNSTDVQHININPFKLGTPDVVLQYIAQYNSLVIGQEEFTQFDCMQISDPNRNRKPVSTRFDSILIQMNIPYKITINDEIFKKTDYLISSDDMWKAIEIKTSQGSFSQYNLHLIPHHGLFSVTELAYALFPEHLYNNIFISDRYSKLMNEYSKLPSNNEYDINVGNLYTDNTDINHLIYDEKQENESLLFNVGSDPTFDTDLQNLKRRLSGFQSDMIPNGSVVDGLINLILFNSAYIDCDPNSLTPDTHDVELLFPETNVDETFRINMARYWLQHNKYYPQETNSYLRSYLRTNMEYLYKNVSTNSMKENTWDVLVSDIDMKFPRWMLTQSHMNDSITNIGHIEDIIKYSTGVESPVESINSDIKENYMNAWGNNHSIYFNPISDKHVQTFYTYVDNASLSATDMTHAFYFDEVNLQNVSQIVYNKITDAIKHKDVPNLILNKLEYSLFDSNVNWPSIPTSKFDSYQLNHNSERKYWNESYGRNDYRINNIIWDNYPDNISINFNRDALRNAGFTLLTNYDENPQYKLFNGEAYIVKVQQTDGDSIPFTWNSKSWAQKSGIYNRYPQITITFLNNALKNYYPSQYSFHHLTKTGDIGEKMADYITTDTMLQTSEQGRTPDDFLDKFNLEFPNYRSTDNYIYVHKIFQTFKDIFKYWGTENGEWVNGYEEENPKWKSDWTTYRQQWDFHRNPPPFTVNIGPCRFRKLTYSHVTSLKFGHPTEHANYNQKLQNVETAQNELDTARQEYEAQLNRYEQGLSTYPSRSNLDQKQAALAHAESQKEHAKGILNAARQRYVQITNTYGVTITLVGKGIDNMEHGIFVPHVVGRDPDSPGGEFGVWPQAEDAKSSAFLWGIWECSIEYNWDNITTKFDPLGCRIPAEIFLCEEWHLWPELKTSPLADDYHYHLKNNTERLMYLYYHQELYRNGEPVPSYVEFTLIFDGWNRNDLTKSQITGGRHLPYIESGVHQPGYFFGKANDKSWTQIVYTLNVYSARGYSNLTQKYGAESYSNTDQVITTEKKLDNNQKEIYIPWASYNNWEQSSTSFTTTISPPRTHEAYDLYTDIEFTVYLEKSVVPDTVDIAPKQGHDIELIFDNDPNKKIVITKPEDILGWLVDNNNTNYSIARTWYSKNNNNFIYYSYTDRVAERLLMENRMYLFDTSYGDEDFINNLFYFPTNNIDEDELISLKQKAVRRLFLGSSSYTTNTSIIKEEPIDFLTIYDSNSYISDCVNYYLSVDNELKDNVYGHGFGQGGDTIGSRIYTYIWGRYIYLANSKRKDQNYNSGNYNLYNSHDLVINFDTIQVNSLGYEGWNPPDYMKYGKDIYDYMNDYTHNDDGDANRRDSLLTNLNLINFEIPETFIIHMHNNLKYRDDFEYNSNSYPVQWKRIQDIVQTEQEHIYDGMKDLNDLQNAQHTQLTSQNQIDDLNSFISSLEAQEDTLEEQIDTLDEQIESYKRDIIVYTHFLNNAGSAAAPHEVQSITDSLETTENSLETAENSLETVVSSLKTVTDQLTNANSNLILANSDNSWATAKIDSITQSQGDYWSSFENKPPAKQKIDWNEMRRALEDKDPDDHLYLWFNNIPNIGSISRQFFWDEFFNMYDSKLDAIKRILDNDDALGIDSNVEVEDVLSDAYKYYLYQVFHDHNNQVYDQYKLNKYNYNQPGGSLEDRLSLIKKPHTIWIEDRSISNDSNDRDRYLSLITIIFIGVFKRIADQGRNSMNLGSVFNPQVKSEAKQMEEFLSNYKFTDDFLNRYLTENIAFDYCYLDSLGFDRAHMDGYINQVYGEWVSRQLNNSGGDSTATETGSGGDSTATGSGGDSTATETGSGGDSTATGS